MLLADLEIHSRYARACGKTINPQGLHDWAKRKGVHLLSSGDITHPLWRREVRQSLEEREPGFYALKNADNAAPRFVLGGEVSLMFSSNEVRTSVGETSHRLSTPRSKGRRVHLLFLAPSFKVVEKLIAIINPKGKLASDGRPILSMSCRDFALACQEADPSIMVIPAHIWTPWFGLLGSKSGFDSIEEAFGDQAHYIHAYETGLSADPAMCWRVDTLNKRVLISGSDLHSYPNMMREATLFHGEIADWNYARLKAVLSEVGHPDYWGTLEFYPQEGKYHADGHAACGIVLEPEQTKKLHGLCPVCGRALTIGVNHRVDDLATHPVGYRPKQAGKIIYAIPLQEIIADALGKKKVSPVVQRLYMRMTDELGNEWSILHDRDDFPSWLPEKIGQGVLKARRGEVTIKPGYDGIYGEIKLFNHSDAKVTLWEQG